MFQKEVFNVNKKLTSTLFTKYPKLFVQKDLDMTKTCMCWGIECGDGWFELIDKVCNDIQTYIDENKLQQAEAVQVKEKFGTLRFYLHGSDEYIENLVAEAEIKSGTICEICGAPAETKQINSYLSTLCDKCTNKEVIE
jgi:hypothetical protein